VIEDVWRSFDRRTYALRGVSLDVVPGEFAALTGPSGSGKSTLLQLIGSLDRPDRGRILVDGVSVGDLRRPADFRRRVVGFVFQLHHLLPTLTAQANVELPLMAVGVGRAERAARARELLREVGMEHRSDHVPSELSGGERQRVAVARALVNRPRLLLADEPTGALDSDASGRVLELLAELRRRHGMTMLIVSYDPAVGAHADRRLRLVDGQLEGDQA
jgi:ABC-type lipoprotein export system ATPase subunit